MFKELSDLKLGGKLLIIMGMLLSACAPEVAARPLYATPCHPLTDEENVYRQPPQSVLSAYYSNAFTNMDFNNPSDVQRYESVQYEALKLLITQTERWSNSIDIHLESKNIRITITYVSPELVQTIILNHYLFRRMGGFLDGRFDTEILSKMNNLASRNEHIFFVTLTASRYEEATSFNNPVIVQLPLQSLVVTNSENVKVVPQHDDHNLEERIDLTHGPAYGYISYPMAVTKVLIDHETCEFLLNKATDTHLTLSMPYIEVNGTRYETGSWMLEYIPLLIIALNSNLSNNSLQVEKNPAHFVPDTEPPAWPASENGEYWEKLARFIWYETTLDP